MNKAQRKARAIGFFVLAGIFLIDWLIVGTAHVYKLFFFFVSIGLGLFFLLWKKRELK